jgi:hypothetical protein
MSEHRRRIDAWITKLEEKASELLEGADLDELSSKERIDLAMKCLGHIQRFVMVNQQLEAETHDGSTTVMLAAMMRQMRGENSVDVPTVEGSTKDG